MLANKYDVFLCDLDGVVYIGNRLLPGSKEAILRLQKMGKQVYYVTNDPRPHRREVAAKLQSLGILARPENCITSGWATACYLAHNNITSACIIGTPSLKKEILGAGVQIVDQDCCQAVVVGYDETVTFHTIEQVVRLIENGARFIATNNDPSFPGPTGRYVATGAIVAAIQAASGVRPVIIGKPSPYLFDLALKNVQEKEKAKVVMIGDSPAADILGAHQLGLNAILINPNPLFMPPQAGYLTADAILPDLSALFAPNITSKSWNSPGYPWPDSVKPGVAAVVFNEHGQVLLGKRRDNGLWGLPSGHVEAGETVAAAVVRELREETGLNTTVQKLIGVYSDPLSQVFSYPAGNITHFITVCFRCSITGGNMKADPTEVMELKFFSPDHLPAALLPMHPQWLTDAVSGQEAGFIR